MHTYIQDFRKLQFYEDRGLVMNRLPVIGLTARQLRIQFLNKIKQTDPWELKNKNGAAIAFNNATEVPFITFSLLHFFCSGIACGKASFWFFCRVGAPPPRLNTVTVPGSETLCFLFVEIRTMDKVQKLNSNESFITGTGLPNKYIRIYFLVSSCVYESSFQCRLGLPPILVSLSPCLLIFIPTSVIYLRLFCSTRFLPHLYYTTCVYQSVVSSMTEEFCLEPWRKETTRNIET
jgi:hypothetical protein